MDVVGADIKLSICPCETICEPQYSDCVRRVSAKLDGLPLPPNQSFPDSETSHGEHRLQIQPGQFAYTPSPHMTVNIPHGQLELQNLQGQFVTRST